MVPYPLRLARMDSDGLFAAYTYTFGMLPRPDEKRTEQNNNVLGMEGSADTRSFGGNRTK